MLSRPNHSCTTLCMHSCHCFLKIYEQTKFMYACGPDFFKQGFDFTLSPLSITLAWGLRSAVSSLPRRIWDKAILATLKHFCAEVEKCSWLVAFFCYFDAIILSSRLKRMEVSGVRLPWPFKRLSCKSAHWLFTPVLQNVQTELGSFLS